MQRAKPRSPQIPRRNTMGMSVNTNVAAMNAYRNLSVTNEQLSRSLERLSSGYRINRAADDAAGLAISEGLRSQLGGYAPALRNAPDGGSGVPTAEGALDETTSILQRMRDLAVQAANEGGLNSDAKAGIQQELNQLKAEVTRIADATSFNGIPLLDGTYDRVFQVGPSAGDTISVTIGRALSAQGLGIDGVNIAATSDPAAVSAYPAQARIDRLQTGQVVFAGATAGGSLRPLTGRITYGGHELDLSRVAFSDTDGNGVVDNDERLAQLNAAARDHGFTHRADPFVDDGDDLIFRGAEPAADATDADLGALSPTYSALSGDVLVVPASTSTPPHGGMLSFPGTSAAGLPSLRGSISANGYTLEFGAVSYTDTDGDGVISGAEALNQLNAAAKAAGITTEDHAFVDSRLLTLDEDEFVDHGPSLQFRGPVPAEDATDEDLTAASPAFTAGQDMITMIDAAIRTVSAQRAELGALQNRLEHTIAYLGGASENTAAALSRIRDADMAQE